MQELNFIGTATSWMLGLVTPVLTNALSYVAKEGTWYFTKKYFIQSMTKILQKHFSEPIMKGLAYFMASVIEDNWDKISQYTSITQIGKFLLNNIFRGSGDLIFGKSNTTQGKHHMTRKIWREGTPIKFGKKN